MGILHVHLWFAWQYPNKQVQVSPSTYHSPQLHLLTENNTPHFMSLHLSELEPRSASHATHSTLLPWKCHLRHVDGGWYDDFGSITKLENSNCISIRSNYQHLHSTAVQMTGTHINFTVWGKKGKKYPKTGQANLWPSRKVLAALIHLNSFNNTI